MAAAERGVHSGPGRLAQMALPLFILVSAVFVTERMAGEALREARNEQIQQLLQRASSARVALESELNTVAYLTSGIESYIVVRKGSIDPAEVEPMLAQLFKRSRHFRNLGIAPDNEIRFIYPLAGNEAALGLRFADNPAQWPSVRKVIESGEPILAGPLELVQGGQALIYRSPIYIEGRYWGLLSTVINASSILDIAAPLANDPSLQFALRRSGDGSSGDQVFVGQPETFLDPPVLLNISVPGGRWQMAVAPAESPPPSALPIRLTGYAVALLAFLLSALALRHLLQRAQLARMEIAMEDSTENLLRTTHMLRSVLSAATRFSIIATDPQGRITLFNRGAELLLGYNADEMIGQHSPLLLHLPTEINARAAELTEQVGHSVTGFSVLVEQAELVGFEAREWTYRTQDGRLLPVMLTVTVLREPQGGTSGYLCIAEDISERKRSDRLKNEFISTVSHELRTPLTAISGSLSLLSSGKLGGLSDSMQTLLDTASRNSRRLELLINDLLDMEKLAAGKLRLDLAVQPLRSIVEQAVRDNQTYAEPFGVTLNVLPGPDPRARVDADRLAQVLANLISNAAKFSPRDAQVEVRIDVFDNRARISVTDHGPGIPEAFRERIFQKFSQADASDTRPRGGTGLGLAISRELVERMHGSIGFDSVEGNGATFWVEFSLKECL